jgi:hypothetical protein
MYQQSLAQFRIKTMVPASFVISDQFQIHGQYILAHIISTDL